MENRNWESVTENREERGEDRHKLVASAPPPPRPLQTSLRTLKVVHFRCRFFSRQLTIFVFILPPHRLGSQASFATATYRSPIQKPSSEGVLNGMREKLNFSDTIAFSKRKENPPKMRERELNQNFYPGAVR